MEVMEKRSGTLLASLIAEVEDRAMDDMDAEAAVCAEVLALEDALHRAREKQREFAVAAEVDPAGELQPTERPRSNYLTGRDIRVTNLLQLVYDAAFDGNDTCTVLGTENVYDKREVLSKEFSNIMNAIETVAAALEYEVRVAGD